MIVAFVLFGAPSNAKTCNKLTSMKDLGEIVLRSLLNFRLQFVRYLLRVLLGNYSRHSKISFARITVPARGTVRPVRVCPCVF